MKPKLKTNKLKANLIQPLKRIIGAYQLVYPSYNLLVMPFYVPEENHAKKMMYLIFVLSFQYQMLLIVHTGQALTPLYSAHFNDLMESPNWRSLLQPVRIGQYSVTGKSPSGSLRLAKSTALGMLEMHANKELPFFLRSSHFINGITHTLLMEGISNLTSTPSQCHPNSRAPSSKISHSMFRKCKLI